MIVIVDLTDEEIAAVRRLAWNDVHAAGDRRDWDSAAAAESPTSPARVLANKITEATAQDAVTTELAPALRRLLWVYEARMRPDTAPASIRADLAALYARERAAGATAATAWATLYHRATRVHGLTDTPAIGILISEIHNVWREEHG